MTTLYTKANRKPVEKDAQAAIAEEFKVNAMPSSMYGSNSNILVSDSGDIFKVPHGAFDAMRVGHEIRVLQHLKGSGALVPDVRYESNAYVLFGMTRVRGELMTPEKIKDLPSAQYESLARSLGAELAKIEKAFLPRPKAFGNEYNGDKVDRVPYPTTLRKAFQIIKAENIGGEEGRFIANLLKAYEDKYKGVTNDRRVLSHNDLGGNVFFEPAAPDKITGIIDFEIAGFRLPEEGFREMWKKFPAKFLSFVLDEYGQQRGQAVPIADVAAVLLNQFLTHGGYNVREAARQFRADFSELEVYAQTLPKVKAEIASPAPVKKMFWPFGSRRQTL